MLDMLMLQAKYFYGLISLTLEFYFSTNAGLINLMVHDTASLLPTKMLTGQVARSGSGQAGCQPCLPSQSHRRLSQPSPVASLSSSLLVHLMPILKSLLSDDRKRVNLPSFSSDIFKINSKKLLWKPIIIFLQFWKTNHLNQEAFNPK